MQPRHISRPLAFVVGGVFALLVNKWTWTGSALQRNGASITNSHHGKEESVTHATVADGLVHEDTFVLPKWNWVDSADVIPSQKLVEESCKARLLVLVLSDARHQWKRDAQREGWASEQTYSSLGVKKGDFKYVYIVGRLFDQISEKVVNESLKSKDIVVADTNDYAIDSGMRKVVWAMKWALKKCTFTHILKTTDHSFVNVPLVVKDWMPRMDNANYYAGSKVDASPVNRDPNTNWYISKEDFAPNMFPIYAREDYVLSRDVVEGLVKSMNETFLKIFYDDVAVAYTLSSTRPQVHLMHEPNVVHKCTVSVLYYCWRCLVRRCLVRRCPDNRCEIGVLGRPRTRAPDAYNHRMCTLNV